MKFKKVFKLSRHEKKIRLFRVIWCRGLVGSGGYSAKVTVGIVPRFFMFNRTGGDDVRLVVCGVDIHFRKSYGGFFI